MSKKIIFLWLFLSMIVKTGAQTVQIENLIEGIRDKLTIVHLIKGEFYYYVSDYEKNIFISRYINKEINISYEDSDKNYLIINKKKYQLSNSYNPLESKIYSIKYKGNFYLCLLGKASSASGSGVQLTNYSLFLKKGKTYHLVNEFYSRFGNIHNIGDFNKDGKFDLIRIERDHAEYKLFISDLKGIDLGMGFMQLRYLEDGSFQILKNKLNIGM